jgi:hypothetical protein
MSAPSLLIGSQSASAYATANPAFATAYSNARYQLPVARTGAEYTDVLDAVDRLALSLADLCRSAVDSLAIAAGLEAEGYNDRTARERFGLPDLFVLAEELHRRVPRELDPAEEPAPPEPTGTPRAILRGLLFATPSLCAMTFLVTDLSGVARGVLAGVQILAWGYGQGVAHLAYGRLNNADRPAAARILRVSTVHALLASAWLLGAMELMLGTSLGALVPAATSLWFCLAAIPALVLGAEFSLAATLGPAALGAAAAWLGAPDDAALVGSQLSAIATVLLMFRLTRSHRLVGDAKSVKAAAGVKARELRGLVPHVLSGLGTGALITVVLAGPAAGQGLVALHAAIVLTLGMGAGEWHARWYQRRVGGLLAVLADPVLFPPRATVLLLVALLRQVVTTAVPAGAGYLVFDRGERGAAGLYFYAVALAPGLLAALFLRGIDATAVLCPIALALLATIAAVPGRNTAVLAVLAVEASVLLTVRAAGAIARPWAHL